MQVKSRKVWIGPCLLVIAGVHTLFAGLIYGDVFLHMLERGVFNTVNRDPQRSAATWFLLFGLVLALLALTITTLEKKQDFPEARKLGIGIFLLCAFSIVLIPASGFWLAIPPAIALMLISPSSRNSRFQVQS
ncbi:DUF6463 family protein [Undibacterium sp. TJN19]|uniref:DUF6463 family protein n=1 Tax=Undibacterium sp. TJN19 TaxID=3413055 RepID=UPI003BEFAB44